MPKLLPGFGRETKATPFGPLETKDAATRRASGGRTTFAYSGQPYYPPGPDVDRMVRDGYEKVIWVFRAIDAIADKMSSWPMEVGTGDPDTPGDWKAVDDPLVPLLNEYSNIIERSAKYFRYRLVSQLLLSKKGVFVEVLTNRMGQPTALNLLPPGLTNVLPDPDTFIGGFRVDTPGADQPYFDLPSYDPESRKSGVVWIRKPHPTDAYSSITPLEAAGISLDLDFYARLYNRNFLLNDGRAGQIVAVKGGLSQEDALELKARFQPGMNGAGRTTVIEADTVNVTDTAVTPRDAQYAELRKITKDDILDALGTDASIIGQVAGRTFDNADAAKENWLDVTVLPLSKVVDGGLDVLTKGGWGDGRRVRHDTSAEPVLRRRWEMKVEKARTDEAAGRITVDEFREIAEMDPMKVPGTRVLWKTTGVPIGPEKDQTAAQGLKQVGAPDTSALGAGGAGDPAASGFDAQVNQFLQGSGGAPGGGPGGTSALSSPQDATTALTAAAADLALEFKDGDLEGEGGAPFLEVKAFNPRQPRYPQGTAKGGQFMDLGDIARWLAGKPLKDGTPASSVTDPNVGSTASPAQTTGGASGASRFLLHPDPKVRAAAATISFPAGYPYARVLGAPPAQQLSSPKNTKLVSLRKGDVLDLPAHLTNQQHGPWTVAAATKVKGTTNIRLELVNADGAVGEITAGAQQTAQAVARTPHPTVVAQAKRDVAAAANAAGAGMPVPAAGPVTVQRGTGFGGFPIPPPPAPGPTVAPRPGASSPFTNVAPGVYISASTGATLHVAADGSGTIQPAGTRLTAAQVHSNLVISAGAQTGGWTMQSAAAVPAAPAPAPVAPSGVNAPTYPHFNLPPAHAGETIYLETTTGKVAYVDHVTGAMRVFNSQGGKATTGANGAQLAAGRGKWQQRASVPTGPVPLGSPAAKVHMAANPSPAQQLAAAATAPVAPTAPSGPVQGPASAIGTSAPFAQIMFGTYTSSHGDMLEVYPDGTGRIVDANTGQVTQLPATQVAIGLQSVGSNWTLRRNMAPGKHTAPVVALAQVNPTAQAVAASGAPQPSPPQSYLPTTHGPSVAPAPAAAPVSSSQALLNQLQAMNPNTPPAAVPTPAAAQPPTPPPPPASSSRAAAVIAAGVPTIAVGPGWTVTGGQGGSNAAAQMTDPSGQAHYVKAQDAKHADNETAAALIYRAAGVQVPTVRRATLTAGLFAGQGLSRQGIASQVVAGTPDMAARMNRDPAYRDAVLEDFAVHAWLGNWDAVENNNTMTVGGKPLTVDVGGSLMFRARGTKRTLPDTVEELTSMRTGRTTGASARSAFTQLKPDASDARFVAGVERVAAISPAQIRDLVDQSMPSFTPAERRKLADTLVARRADLAKHAGVTLPENRQAAVLAAPAPAQVAAVTPPPVGTPQTPPTPAGSAAPPAPAAGVGGPNAAAYAAAQAMLTPPAQYPWPIVLGAPVASPLAAPKPIKAASLRKGDVVRSGGGAVTVVSVDRATGDVTAQDRNGNPVVLPAGPNGTHMALARTPHPTQVAAARRTVAAGAAGTAPQAPPTTAAPAPAVPAASVSLTTPAVSAGVGARVAARNAGSAQSSGYDPVPGQTYAQDLGSVLAVHSDGSSTMWDDTGAAYQLTPKQTSIMLDPGTTFRPVGPQILTPQYSIAVGRWETPAGDRVDVRSDGTGTLFVASTGGTTELAASAVDGLVNSAGANAFQLVGPSPHRSGPKATVPGAPAAGPVARPAGGWVAAGQVLPGAVFVNPNGDTLAIGPRGGGKFTAKSGTSRNMSAAQAQSALGARGSSGWSLQTASPSAGVQQTPTAAVPSAPAVGGPLPSVAPGAPPPLRPQPLPGQGVVPQFVPKVGDPAAPWVVDSKLQAGQVFTNVKSGNTMVINARYEGDLTLGPKARGGQSGPKSAAMTARTLQANGWVLTSGPDIDVPGPMHGVAVRRAQSGVPLPAPGTPIAGTLAKPGTFPAAATGSPTPTSLADVARGETVRIGGEDWILTEVDAGGRSGVTAWGYRPGIDDPMVVVQDPSSMKWHQGQQLPGMAGVPGFTQVDVISSPPQPAQHVPSAGTARAYDPALPAASTVSGVGSAHGAGFDVQVQEMNAGDLKAGDVILVNTREAEGSFVVTRIGQDHRGRDAVYGYSGTAADLMPAGSPPPTEEKLFLAAPNGTMRKTRVQVNGAVSAPPQVPRPAPPQAPSGITRNDISDPSSQARARAIAQAGARASGLGVAPGATRVGDQQHAHMMALRGFNDHPDVVSEDELKQYVAAGEIELWRGTVLPGSDAGEEFRSGANYTGGVGGTMFGCGYYASYGASPSTAFNSHQKAIQFAHDYARLQYSGQSDGVVTHMTIKADAKVGEFTQIQGDLVAAYKRGDLMAKAIVDSRGGLRYGVNQVNSEATTLYAVYLGYDVLRKSNGYKGYTKDPNDWKAGFVVILNRSAVRVSSKNFVGSSGRPPGGDPPPIRMGAGASAATQYIYGSARHKHANGVDMKAKGTP